MILVIHTLKREGIELALIRPTGIGGQSSEWRVVGEFHQSITQKRTEALTPAIDQLLKRLKVKLHALTGVVVATGPGGFSAVRSGVVVANALGLALGIPVAGIEGEFAGLQDLLGSDRFSRALQVLKCTRKPIFARPSYGAEPHITKAKKKKIQQHILQT